MSRDPRRRHPQVIRAVALARAAGLDPYARIDRNGYWGWAYSKFMGQAFDEHYQRTATDGVYWHQGGSFYTNLWEVSECADECAFTYGRCRSGRRWFWRVAGRVGDRHQAGDYFGEHGFADTEEQALSDGTAAIKRFAAGRRVIVYTSHGTAAHHLKQLNVERRKARPPSDARGSKTVEYLYGHTMGGELSDGWPVRFRITKKTAKRIFFLRQEERIDQHGEPLDLGGYSYTSSDDDVIGYVNRQKLEADGEVRNRGVHWCYAASHLYASLQGLLARYHRYREPEPPVEDLAALKAAMAAAHPDRGGNAAAFIAARQRYVAARSRKRVSP